MTSKPKIRSISRKNRRKFQAGAGFLTKSQAIYQVRERTFPKFDKIWFFYHPHIDPNTERISQLIWKFAVSSSTEYRIMKTPTRHSLIWLSSAYLAFGMPANAQATTKLDLDRDGIANINDPDVDNDGLLNGADRNIDGGTARSGPLKGRYIGDRLNNDDASETDMDADGLADNSLQETDIDGDGLADGAANETDIDSDGRADDAANEVDMDGDGKTDDAPNETDIDGDGLEDDAAAETDIDGDNRADNSANETDIDGDGRADDAANETDIDGDGKTDIAANETDIDGDSLEDNAATETDIDGDGKMDDAANEADIDGDGMKDESTNEADIDGDNLLDDASNEHDVDGDGLNDEALKETDIDGDNLENATDNETDIDGDNIINDEDPDMDSDGVENEIDEDFDNDGVKDTIDFTDDGGNGSFIDDDSAEPTNDFVSTKLSELLGVANDSKLKVAVMSTTEPYGTWNYTTSDGISVNGVWSYPADKPEELKPFMSNVAGENRIYAQYPNGFLTFYSWLPGEPVGFAFSTLSEQATGKTAPIARLHSYVSGFPNAYPEILPQVISGWTSIMFSGDLRVFDGIGPILDQQRAIFKIVTDWEKENYPADRR